MPASPGYLAVVYIGSTPAIIGNLTQADLSINGDVYDITALGQGDAWKRKLGGLADYMLKLSGYTDFSDAQQMAIQAATITNPGAMVSWQIKPKGAATTTLFSGTAINKSEGLKFAVNKQDDISFDLDGSGPIVFTP